VSDMDAEAIAVCEILSAFVTGMLDATDQKSRADFEATVMAALATVATSIGLKRGMKASEIERIFAEHIRETAQTFRTN